MKRSLADTARALLFVALLHPLLPVQAADCADWPDWNKFRAHFLSEDGRVVDPSTPDGQTTSEGQSYGLFFALVGNDRESFARILRWTEKNLANDDLTARLPAWQWGKRADGSWGVLDSNAASDADLWIAYTLIEAGRLWKNPKYNALGELLAERILREESVQLPELGTALLPGSQGFRPQEDTVRLNPSYLPLQIMRRMAALHPKSAWKQMASSSIETIVRSAPLGFAPDWIRYKSGQGFQVDSDTGGTGSFNAIRVYLWAGTLAENEPVRTVFIRHFAPMLRVIENNGAPPQEIDTRHGTVKDPGPAGFSAAMLPLLEAAKKPQLLRQQRLRIEAKSPLERDDNYYEQSLTLFGLGWMENHYRFASDGALTPRWTCAAN
jgi:endoglucanase